MDVDEFDKFLTNAVAELEVKQQRLQEEYRLANFAWEFQPETAKIRFKNEQGQTMVDADVVFIGSYSLNSGTWLWAWSNIDISMEDRAKSEKIREIAKLKAFPIFEIDHQMEVEEFSAFDFSAMAIHHLKAEGLVCLPNRDHQTSFFCAMMHLRRHHTDQW